MAQGRKDSLCPRQGLCPPCLVVWEGMLGWCAPAQAEVAWRWRLMFTRGFRHRSAGNTELEMAKGMANSEPNTRDGLRQGGEGDGRQRNTYTLGHCAQLFRLCTAQRAPHLRNHGFVYLNDNFPADGGKASCSPHIGGFQLFSHRQSVLCKGCSFQICTKVPYGPVAALHRDQEGKGTLSLSLAHAHTHTHTQPRRDQEKDKRKLEKRQVHGKAGAAISWSRLGRRSSWREEEE